MAHRRKNSHPLCKQKRISTVVELLSARSRVDCENDSKLSAHLDEDAKGTQDGLDFDAVNQKIDIPEDLFKDFQALKSATNLDTTDLMRKLITDYAQLSTPDTKKSTQGKDHSAVVMDTAKLSEYYREQEQRYVLKDDVEFEKRETPNGSQLDQPLDLSTMKSDESAIDERHSNLPSQNYTYLFDTRDTSSIEDQVGDMASRDRDDTNDNSNKSSPAHGNTEEHYHEIEFQNGSVKIQGTKSNPKIQVEESDSFDKGPPPPYPYVNMPGVIPILQNSIPGLIPIGNLPENFPLVNPGIVGGIPLLPQGVTAEALQIMNSPQVNPMISGGIPENESTEQTTLNSVHMSNLETSFIPGNQNSNKMNKSETKGQAENISQLWNPMPAKRGYFSGAAKKKRDEKGKMKLIAENTSNRGVYTSVLKLPWSRRTRTPKTEMNQAPHHIHTAVNSQPPQIQQHVDHDSAQQPSIVFVPVPTANMPTSQGVFIPNSSLPLSSGINTTTSIESPPVTTQSMMMVYPNTNLNSLGKPVRKRGRPPKMPTMAKMLADANKKSKYDTSLPTLIQNFNPCQQPAAIVLNVNNMLNTGNAVTATNSINSNSTVNTTVMDKADSVPQEVNVSMVTSSQQEMPQNVPVMTTVFPMQSQSQAMPQLAACLNVNMEQQPGQQHQGQQHQGQQHQGQQHPQNILPKCDISNVPSDSKHIVCKTDSFEQDPQTPSGEKSSEDMEMKMVTTTTMANAATGALYQEMILSSKSLVNIRPRRRQTTTELLKSKSVAQNFICTSFRLRSLSGSKKEKKVAQYVPGMKRRGRPPKKRLENMFEGQMVEIDQENLEKMNQNQVHLSNIQNQQLALQSVIQKSDNDKLNMSVNDNFAGMVKVEKNLNVLNNDKLLENHGEGSDIDQGSDGTQSYSRGSSPESVHSSDSYVIRNPEQECSNEMFQQLFHCKICNEIVPVDKKDDHWLKHSKESRRCSSCGGLYQKFLYRDREDCEPVQMLKCENCEKIINSIKDNVKSISCSECGEFFKSVAELNQHKVLEHQGDPAILARQVVCKLCGKVLSDNLQLQNHMKSHEEVFQCQEPSCGKKYGSKQDLKTHVQRRHSNQQVHCIYQGCNKKFQNNLHLQEHIQFKHLNTISIKSYKCSWQGCEDEFESERQLKIHLLIHQDEKPIKCQLCDYRCRQQSALIWHIRKHHPEASQSYTANPSGSSTSSLHEEDDVEEEGSQ